MCGHLSHPQPLEVPDKLLFGHIRQHHREEWANIERGRLLTDLSEIVAALRGAAGDLDQFSYARANAVATMRIVAASLEAVAAAPTGAESGR